MPARERYEVEGLIRQHGPDANTRLGVPADLMGIAEGIETALSAAQLYKMPVWACMNATTRDD